MNSRPTFFAPFLFLIGPLLAQDPGPPPPVAPTLPPSAGTVAQLGTQRAYGLSSDTLISRQTADGLLVGFHKVYVTDHAPRIVIYVNRALVDSFSGLKLTKHTETYATDGGTTKTTGENTYAVKDAPAPTLADQQTVREVERLVGRVFRNAGATLADWSVAGGLLPSQPGGHLTGDLGAKDREALAAVADIAIEVLISSRNLTVQEVSGTVTYTVPDIQATAIRLKDATIVGQAAASDVLGKNLQAGKAIRQFDVRDITEATALALISDMLTGQKTN